jgi:hypothetical protein
MNTTIAPTPAARPSDFADLVNLFAALTKSENNLARLQQVLDSQHLETVQGHMEAYKEIQTLIGECEAAIKVIAARNPQWFEDKKSIAMPVGELKRTTSTSIEIADEEITMTLIRNAGRAAEFIKTSHVISKEALELLKDEDLKKFGVKRVVEHNYKCAPASVDLGKAVKAADKSAKAAAKTAKAAGGGK